MSNTFHWVKYKNSSEAHVKGVEFLVSVTFENWLGGGGVPVVAL